MEKITVLVVEDHALVRQTWVFLLNMDSRFAVAGECATGEEAIEIAKNMRPNVVLLDINLGKMTGFETASQIRKYSPGSKIVGLSLHTQLSYVKQLLKCGATGYITKNSTQEEFFHVISEAHNGRQYICAEVRQLLADREINNESDDQRFHSLSKSELRIISYLKQGLISKEIATATNLSVKTVEVHRYNILKKLKLPNVASLINYINNSEFALSL